MAENWRRGDRCVVVLQNDIAGYIDKVWNDARGEKLIRVRLDDPTWGGLVPTIQFPHGVCLAREFELKREG